MALVFSGTGCPGAVFGGFRGCGYRSGLVVHRAEGGVRASWDGSGRFPEEIPPGFQLEGGGFGSLGGCGLRSGHGPSTAHSGFDFQGASHGAWGTGPAATAGGPRCRWSGATAWRSRIGLWQQGQVGSLGGGAGTGVVFPSCTGPPA